MSEEWTPWRRAAIILEWLDMGGEVRMPTGHTILACENAQGRPSLGIVTFDEHDKRSEDTFLVYDLDVGSFAAECAKLPEAEITVILAQMSLTKVKRATSKPRPHGS